GVLTRTNLRGLGMGPMGIAYMNIDTLNIHLGSGNDAFTICDSNPGKNPPPGVTNIDSAAGKKNFSVVSTSGPTNLSGGPVGGNIFTFGNGADLSGGMVNGGGGPGNLLNFTAYLTPVFVNLSDLNSAQLGLPVFPDSFQRAGSPFV